MAGANLKVQQGNAQCGFVMWTLLQDKDRESTAAFPEVALIPHSTTKIPHETLVKCSSVLREQWPLGSKWADPRKKAVHF
jgi:hypothetical protein